MSMVVMWEMAVVISKKAKTLAKELNGIGLSKAEAIVAHREKNGPFKSADDLAKVKGIGAKTVERIKPDLRFEAAKPGG